MTDLKVKLALRYFQTFLLSASAAVLFLCTAISCAQSTSTNIQISGSVQQRAVNRLGVNLSDQSYWDSGQMMKNLINENPGFEGLTYREIFRCAQVSGQSCTDNSQGSAQPSAFWNGGHFEVMSGNAAGVTGSIASSTAEGSCASCRPTMHFDRSLDLAVGDYVSVEIDVPGSGDSGWSGKSSGGGTISTETADLSPETPGKQALLLSAGRAQQSVTTSETIGTLEGQSHIRLNGTFQVSFRAKGVGGNNQLSVHVERLSTGIAPYLNETVPLTNTWQDYTLSFSANEAGTALGLMQLSFTATGANVELDDVSLMQTNSSPDNPTVFRDEVVNALKELNPGTIRMLAGSAANIANQLKAPYARYGERFGANETTNPNIAYGIHEFLQLCATVGSDPWITISPATTPKEMTDLIEYLSGNGSDPWSALRVARGQTAPWTSVFDKVHIELGNETGNGSIANEPMSSPAYSQWANLVFGAARQTTGFEIEKFDLILSGSASSPRANAAMLTSSTQHDSFDIAPYLLLSAKNEAQAKMFGALFAEPELLDSPGGEVSQNIQVGASTPSATEQSTNMNVSESDLSPVRGNITQAQLDQLLPSVGAGIAQTEHMLQMMRVGAKYQNAFGMAPYEPVRGDGSPVKLLERGVDMGTADRRGPHFLTQALANSVIGGDMLQTVQSGANPTWNQPLSSDNVQLNGAHYLQSFAFLKGTSSSVIVFNLNLAKALPVTFSGPNAPAGTVEMTQLTSGQITDNNETSAVVQPATQTLSSFNPASGLLLPPFSMTLLSWTSEAVQPPIFSVPAGTYSTKQVVAISSTTRGASIYYTTDGSAPTTSSSLYSSPIAVGANQTLKAIAIAPGFERSPVAAAAYHISAALPALDVTSATTAGSTIVPAVSAPASSLAAGTDSIKASAATGAQSIFACSSGFTSSAGSCSHSTRSGAASFWSEQALSGSEVPVVPEGCVHCGNALDYQSKVNVQAFTTTFTFVPNEYNGVLVFQNNTNADASGAICSGTNCAFAAGAGYEGGFYQAFSANRKSTNNIFALEFYDTHSFQSCTSITCFGANYTYSTAQIYQAQQPPYNPNYGTESWYWTTDKISTNPVPINSPFNLQQTTTGDTYSATVTYDGTNFTYSLYDVTAGGSCPGASCFTQTWNNVNIPSIVGSNTAYIGLTGGSNGASLHPYNITGWSYAVNTPPSSPSLSSYTSSAASGSPYVTAPTFSPMAGTYPDTQSVTISSTTTGAYYCYTLSATTPSLMPQTDNSGGCTVGTLYSGAVSVPSSQTLYAMAGVDVNGGIYKYLPSNLVTAAYTIGGSQATAPSCTPTSGSSSSPITVTCSNPNSGAAIMCYTANGTTPVTNGAGTGCTTGTALSGSSGNITISSTTATLNVVAGASTLSDSKVSFYGPYTINTVLPTPTFSVAGGTYATSQSVTISDTTAGTTIYYTTNGTQPTTSSTVYTGAISVSATETLEAFAVETGYTNSAVASAAYTISLAVPAPTFSPAPGTYTTSQLVTISETTAGTTIFYTTNGTTPTTSSTVYTGPITVNSTETLEAIAVVTGDSNAVGTATYTIAPVLPAPAFSLAAGTYTSAQTVSISDGTAGTTIYYTTNGIAPTTSSTMYTGPITVGATETLEAIAVETGYTNSSAATVAYTIAPVLPAPAFSLAAGTYTTTQTVTISDSTSGTTIHYTTNGTTPTTSSSVYSGPITVSATETLEAIAVETGYTNSSPATVAYTIAPVLPEPAFSLAAGTYTTAQTVTISDSIAGTTIHYTTNGTTPTTSSSVYSGPLTVSATETLEAIATETGYTNSSAATAAYTIAPVLPAPSFTPAAGTYTTAQTVTISEATAGTTIYYTTNGAAPTTSSTAYTAAITVSATETLKAIAVKTGDTNSAAASAAYIIAPLLPAPAFSLAAGTYTTTQTVSISDTNAGTTIHYTTNGTAPTTSSSVYSGPITVSATETLEAIAVETGYTNSEAATAAYTIAPVLPEPAFSLAAGGYTTAQTVTISDATAGTTIRYTTNGTAPTTSSIAYTGPITVSATETIEAIAVKTGYTNSAAASAAYTIAPLLPEPAFSVAAGTYATAQTVSISDAVAGTTIHYTTNGTVPTTSSTVYTGPIAVGATETIEAIAVKSGYFHSAAASAAYTISPLLPAPVFSLAAGTYTTKQTVTISDATAGTTIHYTTNGTAPTASSTAYTAAITVSATETLKAIAVKTGYTNSAAASATYTIAPVLPTPTFNVAAGTYTTAQIVTISDTTAGTTIHYTTNGTTPTTSSSVYTGPITVSATETLQAIAAKTGYTNSAAAKAAYTIAPVLPSPVFSLASGGYTTAVTVTISDATAGTTIHYTTNGTVPTTSSTVYTGPIAVNATETLEAIAVKTGYTNSAAASAAYTIAPLLPAPAFSLKAGTYTSAQTVSISDAIAGTTIHYTTNGTVPTTSSTVYTGPIAVSATETIEAIAVKSGYFHSAAASAAYTIAPVLPAPAFSLKAGTYTTAQTVTISDATAGTTIHYTTNGTAPTTSATAYTAAIKVSATETLKAIAVKTGYTDSSAASAAYTITSDSSSAEPNGFSITATPSTASVVPGGSTAFSFTATPQAPATTVPTSLSFRADGLPLGAKYSFSPITLVNGVATSTMEVQMPQTASATEPAGAVSGSFGSRISPLSLALLLLPLAGRLRRAGKRFGHVMSLLLLLVTTLALAGLSGCGSSVSGFLDQSYSVKVTGTSGSLTQSTIVALTVKQ